MGGVERGVFVRAGSRICQEPAEIVNLRVVVNIRRMGRVCVPVCELMLVSRTTRQPFQSHSLLLPSSWSCPQADEVGGGDVCIRGAEARQTHRPMLDENHKHAPREHGALGHRAFIKVQRDIRRRLYALYTSMTST